MSHTSINAKNGSNPNNKDCLIIKISLWTVERSIVSKQGQRSLQSIGIFQKGSNIELEQQIYQVIQKPHNFYHP